MRRDRSRTHVDLDPTPWWRSGRIPLLLVPLGVVLAGIVSAGVGTVALMIVAPQTVEDVTRLRFTQTLERIRAAEVGREYRLPTDPAISVDEVTEAFLVATGDWDFDGPSPESLGESPLVAGEGSPYPPTQRLSIGEVLPAAARGLTADERRYLEAFAADPRLDMMSAVARAEQFDGLRIAELQYEVEWRPSESSTHWEAPILRVARLRESAYNKIAEAGLHLDAGDVEAAEHALRVPISVGLLMVDEGTMLTTALVGAVVTDIGLDHLERLFEVTGQVDRHDQLIKARAEAVASAAIDGEGDGLGWDEITDNSVPRQLRFEGLGTEVVLASCGSPDAILFGPSEARIEYAETTLRAELVRTEREAWLFDTMLEWESRMARADANNSLSDLGSMHAGEIGIAVAAAIADVFGQQRVEACWQTLALM